MLQPGVFFINNKHVPLLQTLTEFVLFLFRSLLDSLFLLPLHRRHSSLLYGARHRPVLQLEPHCCVETMSNIQRWGWVFYHSFIHKMTIHCQLVQYNILVTLEIRCGYKFCTEERTITKIISNYQIAEEFNYSNIYAQLVCQLFLYNLYMITHVKIGNFCNVLISFWTQPWRSKCVFTFYHQSS